MMFKFRGWSLFQVFQFPNARVVGTMPRMSKSCRQPINFGFKLGVVRQQSNVAQMKGSSDCGRGFDLFYLAKCTRVTSVESVNLALSGAKKNQRGKPLKKQQSCSIEEINNVQCPQLESM